jgi:hypothetical protein
MCVDHYDHSDSSFGNPAHPKGNYSEARRATAALKGQAWEKDKSG